MTNITNYCTNEDDCRMYGGGTVHQENGLVRCLGCGRLIAELHDPTRHTACAGADSLKLLRAWARAIAMGTGEDGLSNEELQHAKEHFRLLEEFLGPDSIDAKFAAMVDSEIAFRQEA